ncbi:MAG: tRNA epoxyqueuosine(34) reductase QueG [Acidobacteria bacterium]|nr:MAG: tRNA epoxyqueuosine(34) reductase QueG [Acidobacteriota bacterium]PYQ83189.1 MAG: tRNA epoxyqueuosine(34) reductase QueG [Acidobacteriota bacterium]PYQ87462.1 MAG: tRNA epoxyqueuosine(34) reductase QueG [Acidobacteriota bacterium]PYR05413.1 MAG: tRNA epoxyqueuosine(34) reductase QueG [Acidobacteriota bacterium]PYR13577.1 MAG: tRNA epoxyqueuosine(34) reductase QueG [Acidobacteriota bacterium]
MLTSSTIKDKARGLGFDLCGIAPAGDLPELTFFREWLERGYAGEMTYLHRSAARRADVRNVLPSARTVVVTATNYNTDRPYSTECADAGRAHVARYAWGDDYHDVIGGRLDALLSWMRHEAAEPFEARAYVDTGPVQERVYAQHAGIGWIGKNTCVINPEIGSWIFLGVIICSLPLEVDLAALDRCGTCTLCLEACPTGAIVAPGVLDSNRCISYLTIELRGDIPEAMRAAIGTHIYGCDICQEVCPWNATPPRSPDRAWQPRSVWDRVDLLTLAGCTDDELADSLRGSAMRRTRVQGLRRNIDTALGNACDAETPATRRRRTDS